MVLILTRWRRPTPPHCWGTPPRDGPGSSAARPTAAGAAPALGTCSSPRRPPAGRTAGRAAPPPGTHCRHTGTGRPAEEEEEEEQEEEEQEEEEEEVTAACGSPNLTV